MLQLGLIQLHLKIVNHLWRWCQGIQTEATVPVFGRMQPLDLVGEQHAVVHGRQTSHRQSELSKVEPGEVVILRRISIVLVSFDDHFAMLDEVADHPGRVVRVADRVRRPQQHLQQQVGHAFAKSPWD